MNESLTNLSQSDKTPKFPNEIKGIYSERRYTDPLFILIFLLFIILFITISLKFFSTGNLHHLSFSLMTDSNGNKCGFSLENNEYPYLYHGIVQIQRNISLKILSIQSFCVKACPKKWEIPFDYSNKKLSFIEYPTLVFGHYCLMNIKKITKENTKNNSDKDVLLSNYNEIDEAIKRNVRINFESLFERGILFLFTSKYIIIFLFVPLSILILYTFLVRVSIKFAIWFIISFLIFSIGLVGLIIFIQNIDFENNYLYYSYVDALYLWLIDVAIFLFTWIYQDSIVHFIEYLTILSEIIKSKRVMIVHCVFLILNIILFLVFLLEEINIHYLFSFSSSFSKKAKFDDSSYKTSAFLIILLLYLWSISFLMLFKRFVISLLVSIWIFAGSNEMKGSTRLVLMWGFFNHLGSLTLGSILLPFISIIRILSYSLQILLLIFIFLHNLLMGFLLSFRTTITYPSFFEYFNLLITSLSNLNPIIIGIEGSSYFQTFKRIFDQKKFYIYSIEKPTYSLQYFRIYLTSIFSLLSVVIMIFIDISFECFTNNNFEDFKLIIGVAFAFSWLIFDYDFILLVTLQNTFLYWFSTLEKKEGGNDYPDILKIIKKRIYHKFDKKIS